MAEPKACAICEKHHGEGPLGGDLVGRYPGTPPEYRWTRVDEWPRAPRGDPAEVAPYCARLREAL